ncbi:MAG: aminoglycoside phosphotransferase family protein [Rudanella sp.]|nr:aminoglycoside phosphotransferase family protein [Rudanella sp.]
MQHYLSPAFIEQLMRKHAPENNIRVFDCQPLPIDNSASILAVLTAGQSEKPIGHFGLAVDFESAGVRKMRRLVMKIKPHGGEVVAMLQQLAQACGGPLAEIYPTYASMTGFLHTHGRELEVYAKLPSALQPDIFGTYADEPNGAYLILMEFLDNVDLLNSAMTPEAWTDEHIRLALSQIAAWHAQHLNKRLPLNPAYWDDYPSAAYMANLSPLWAALLQNAADHFPDLYNPDRVQRLRVAIEAIPAYWRELTQMPKTLIHNDLNPRNTCFKTVNGSPNLCVYDWELATFHVPQYDVVELLCFVLDTDRYDLRESYLEQYRKALHERTGLYADERAFRRGFELAAYDFGLHRLGMYMMAHTVSPYPFLPRVVGSYFDMLSTFSNNPYSASS